MLTTLILGNNWLVLGCTPLRIQRPQMELLLWLTSVLLSNARVMVGRRQTLDPHCLGALLAQVRLTSGFVQPICLQWGCDTGAFNKSIHQRHFWYTLSLMFFWIDFCPQKILDLRLLILSIWALLLLDDLDAGLIRKLFNQSFLHAFNIDTFWRRLQLLLTSHWSSMVTCLFASSCLGAWVRSISLLQRCARSVPVVEGFDLGSVLSFWSKNLFLF